MNTCQCKISKISGNKSQKFLKYLHNNPETFISRKIIRNINFNNIIEILGLIADTKCVLIEKLIFKISQLLTNTLQLPNKVYFTSYLLSLPIFNEIFAQSVVRNDFKNLHNFHPELILFLKNEKLVSNNFVKNYLGQISDDIFNHEWKSIQTLKWKIID